MILLLALVMAYEIDSEALSAELLRRFPVEQADAQTLIANAAADLRSIFKKHPKQARMYRSKAKLKATRKTRRAGATAGGVRELLARSIEMPGHRSTYCASTRIEAKERAWVNDTQSGFVDVLRAKGEHIDNPGGVEMWRLGGITVEIRELELALDFSNGSRIELFGADNIRAIQKKRGHAKHVFWIDEAQDFRFLEDFYGGTVVGSLTDTQGECWVSGTPGRDCSGMFYEITRDDGQSLPGWEVHEIAVVDNPFFGCVAWIDGQWFVEANLGARFGPYPTEQEAEDAAVQIRWDRTAGEAKRRNSWPDDHPDLLREWLAKWVRTDTMHVYPVNAAPPTCKLVYAPQRLVSNTFRPQDPAWYDHDAASLDLPYRRKREWLYAIGIDFGHFPDPFAIAVWAFAFDVPDIYEMFSWKAVRVLPDDQRQYVEMLWHAIGNIVVLVADPSGREGELEAWRTRFNLPIDNADKARKDVYQEIMAGDIRGGRVHYREGSPLLDEHRHLVYLPTKPGKKRIEHADRKVGNRTPGNHASDAALYSHRHLQHFLYREPPKDERTADTKLEQEIEDRIDQNQRLRELAEMHGEYDGYDY